MIDFKIDGNFDKFSISLDQIDTKLNMLRVPLEKLEETLQRIFDIKFRMFERHRNAYTPAYRKWKDEMGLPVGVKTGKTRKALTKGGEGVINEVVLHPAGGFVYEYGINADEFFEGRGYPRRFDKWLEMLGDDLVGVSNEEAELIFGELTVYVNKYIDTL